jgi:hypothetical protein
MGLPVSGVVVSVFPLTTVDDRRDVERVPVRALEILDGVEKRDELSEVID